MTVSDKVLKGIEDALDDLYATASAASERLDRRIDNVQAQGRNNFDELDRAIRMLEDDVRDLKRQLESLSRLH